MPDAILQQCALGAGLDETNEDVFVPSSSMRICQDVTFLDGNSAQTRYGQTSIKTLTVDMPYAKRLVTHGSEVLVTDGNQLASINGNLPGINLRGQVSPCALARRLFASGNNTAAVPATSLASAFPIVPLASIATDAATKLRVEVANDGYNLLAAVYDEVGGAYVLPITPVGAGAPAANIGASSGAVTGIAYQPRVVIVSSVAWLFFHMPGVAGIQAYALELTNLGAGWSVASAGLGSIFLADTGVFDVCAVQGTSTIAIVAYETSTEALTLNTFTVAANAITAGSRVSVQDLSAMTSPGVDCVSVQAATATDGIVVAWGFHNTPSAGTVFYSLNWASYTTLLTVIQANSALVDSSYTPGSPLPQGGLEFDAVAIARQTGTGTGNTASWLIAYTRHYRLAQQPYASGAQTAAAVLDTGQFGWLTITTASSAPTATFPLTLGVVGLSKIGQYTVAGAVCFYQLLATLAGANPQIGAQYRAVLSNQAVPESTQSLVLVQLNPSGSNNVPTVAAQAAMLSAGDVVPSSFDVAVSSDGSGLVFVGTEQDSAGSTNVSTLRANFTDPQLWQFVELGNWTWLAGGCPMQYDGSSLVEVGFIQVPQCPTVALAASGSATLPKIAMVSTAGGLQYMVVWVWQDNSGNVHQSSPSLASSIDSSAGYPSAQIVCQVPQLTYRSNVRCNIYRNNSATPTIFQLIASIATEPTSTTVTFVDEITDGQNLSQPEVYTQGGTVPATAPPNLVGLVVYANRVMGIDADGVTLWFTTAWTPAASPWFSDSFTIPWPTGPITALWWVGQQLMAATDSDTYYVLGEGPTDTGVGVDWTVPTLWRPGLGVPNARSVAWFDDGAILNTNRGLYEQAEDGSFTWLSKCRRTLAQFTNAGSDAASVIGIVPVDSDGSVRVLVLGAFNSSAAIYWDHRRDRWSVHTAPTSGTYLDGVEAGGAFYGLVTPAAGGVYVTQEQSPVGSLSGPSYIDNLAGIKTWIAPVLSPGWFLPGEEIQGWGTPLFAQTLGLWQTAHGMSVAWYHDYAAISTAPDVTVTMTDAQVTALASNGTPSAVEQVRWTAPSVAQLSESVTVVITTSAPTTGVVGTGQAVTFSHLLVNTTENRGEYPNISGGALQ